MEATFYLAQSDARYKVMAKVTEKLYLSGKKTLIVFDNQKSMNVADQVIWTFESAKFIPHLTELDTLAEECPVLLSTKLLQFGANAVIVNVEDVSLAKNNILSSGLKEKFDNLERLAFLACHEDWVDGRLSPVKKWLTEAEVRHKAFCYNQDGKWEDIGGEGGT